MDISITAVTGNRRFVKALTRISPLLASLKLLAQGVDTTREPFDVLQLVFMDRPPTHLKSVGTKRGDRLFQVEVGIPSPEGITDETLLHEVAARIEMAISVCPLSDPAKQDILSRFE